MSFASQSELPQHLTALATLTQWHSNTSNKPLEVRLTITQGGIDTVNCLVTGSYTEAAPATYVQAATVAAYQLAQAGHFKGSFTVRINSVPGGQTVVKQTPLATPAEETAPEPQPTSSVSNDGLQLRAALLARGHHSGYSAEEVAQEEKERGITYTPELKFYRALVREGVVAERGQHQVLASPVQADFGASSIDSVPWRAPHTTDGTVQAVLNHSRWIEIAHDPDHLYAIDLAPGAQGTQGQVIARRRNEASVPVRVALSLAQFVTGDFTDSTQQASPARAGANLAQTIAWAGSVEAEPLPALLGWTQTPSAEDYRRLTEQTSQQGESAKAAPAQDAQKAHELGAEEASSQNRAPEGQASEEQTSTEKAPSDAPKEQGDKGQQAEQEETLQEQDSPAEEAPSPGVTALFTADYQVPTSAEDEELDDLADVDPGVAKVPSSPEQKLIADSFAALAFGGAEKRLAPEQDVDTASIPSIASQVKKVGLADAPLLTPIQKAPKEEGGFRAALRKLFGGN